MSDAAVVRSSSLMATGTVVSRVTGVLRTTATAAAIGTLLLADAYQTANTLPNVVYILLVGGALNAVFIPQLVRRMRDDADGGQAYSDRLLTAALVLLAAITVLATLAAPWVVRAYAAPNWSADTLSVATRFAYFCLPQIFFYGAYTLFAQVLNARGHFGTPMFAPVLNNLVVIGGCVAFIAVTDHHAPTPSTITQGQLTLLASITTIGVVVQAAVLVPVLARSGYRLHPRFDWRGHGLGKAASLARWTVALVAANQLAFLVVTRLANRAGTDAVDAGAHVGAGSYVYGTAYLIFVLPHSVVTVSVVTALLPRMSRAAHAGDVPAVRRDVSRGIVLVSTAIVPASVVFLLLAPRLAQLLVGYGATSDAAAAFIGTVVQAFSVGMVPFSVYYVLLRGYYAQEDTRSPALNAVLLNVVNIVAAYALFLALPAHLAVAGLALAYALAYLVATVVLWVRLAGRLGGLDSYLTVRSLVRLVLAGALAGVVGYLLRAGLGHLVGPGKLGALVEVLVVGAGVGAVFLALARRLRVAEVGQLVTLVRRRAA